MATALTVLIVLAAVLWAVVDAECARRRVLRYCRTARMDVLSLRFYFGWKSPFTPFRGRYTFRAVLQNDAAAAAFNAWFSAAGLVMMTSDDPLEVRFTR